MRGTKKLLIGFLVCLSVLFSSIGLAACEYTESAKQSSDTGSCTSIEQNASDSSQTQENASDCSHEQEDSSDCSHEHQYTAVVTAPTCTEQGFTTYTCSCGDSYVDTYVNELDHEFKNYVSNGDAKCETDGTETAVCEREDCEVTDTRTQENSALEHIYDRKMVETKYQKSEATCTSKAVYYRSCVCGKANATETFEYGDCLEHKINDLGICRVCEDPILPTHGVLYEKLPDGTARAIAYEGQLVKVRIAETYDGAPVTKIDNAAFRNSNVTRIIIPDSVKSIEQYAFYGCERLTSITFQGTIKDWIAVSKGDKWSDNVAATKVVCSDGEVEI